MKRVSVLLVALVGCQQPDTRSVAEKQQPVVEKPHSAAEGQPPTTPAVGIEFAKWPTATRWPIDVSPHVSFACGVYRSAEQIWAGDGGDKRHGPHFKHQIVVRINPGSEEEFKALASPLPVGTVVVKEKHGEHSTEGPPSEYGAMIKRETGYDPEHGDWEYLYVMRGPEEKVTRGRLGSCIDCHSRAKHRDYVFSHLSEG